MDEPVAARPLRGAELEAVGREDLDGYAVAELAERIARLEAEIARTRSALERKRSGRSAADRLFSFGGGS